MDKQVSMPVAIGPVRLAPDTLFQSAPAARESARDRKPSNLNMLASILALPSMGVDMAQLEVRWRSTPKVSARNASTALSGNNPNTVRRY